MTAQTDVASTFRLTPTGHLRLSPDAKESGAIPQAAADRILAGFAVGESAGLFALVAHPISGGLSPAIAFWHSLASRSLTARCHAPLDAGELAPLPPLPAEELARLLLEAPPMVGGEYLDVAVLQRIWSDLDAWVRAEVESAGGLEAFLTARAPLWRQVGRVCFHLAENKKDPALPFAFLATYAPRLSASARVSYVPLSHALRELAGERNRAALVRLLTPVEQAARKSALIRELLDSGDIYHALAWTPEEAYRFLREIPDYEESGLLVRVPDWWSRRPRPKVAVRIGSEPRTSLGVDTLMDFEVEIALGGATLTASEVRKLLAGDDGLVLLKGQWVEVDKAKLQEALTHWEGVQEQVAEGGISFAEGMRLLAGAREGIAQEENDEVAEWSFVDAGEWLKDLLARLRSPETIEAALPGRALHAALRPYQEAGARWLWLLTGLGLGACLADDMGLGKTIQVLALLLMAKKATAGPSLLVLPASLLANWRSEIERFSPSLEALYVHPSMGVAPGDLTAALIDGSDAVLTTYGMLQRAPLLSQQQWNLVVLDEAQAIKNPGARQTRAAKALKARARIALTGT
ncbi:MAG TPA: SNF2 helicase-associated domain-containing protein, partial [Spirochaetia bacterium]